VAALGTAKASKVAFFSSAISQAKEGDEPVA
jgi:hypothetical protein